MLNQIMMMFSAIRQTIFFLQIFVIFSYSVRLSSAQYPCSRTYNKAIDVGQFDSPQLSLSVTVDGNPSHYSPGEQYSVTITLSSPFTFVMISSIQVDTQVNNMHMCTPVINDNFMVPQATYNFYWTAPSSGSGCIGLVAMIFSYSTSLLQNLMFYEICEGGIPLRLPFASIDSGGVILRDDFDSDSNSALNYIWSEVHGGEISDTCGTVMYGKSMVFCNPRGPRELNTVHLNTSTASVLQFAISVGTCHPGVNDYSITVSYAISDQRDWRIIDRIPVPVNTSEAVIHIIHLPKEARQDDICLRFNQDLAMDTETYEGCWALDNVLIINAANPPSHLQANFDPVDPNDWLFLPNAVIKNECNSEGNALVFRGMPEYGYLMQSVTSRDLNLFVEGTEPILQQSFDYHFPEGWAISGAEISNICGRVYGAKAAVFNGPVQRSMCTPFQNATGVGNFRFYFTLGGGSCDPADSADVSVSVVAEVSGQFTYSVELARLAHNTYKVSKLVSVVVPPKVQTSSTRFCIVQHRHNGLNRNVWAVDNVHLLPTVPSRTTHLLQFNLHAGCGELRDPSEIHVEFSTDHGLSWSFVQSDCLPGQCQMDPTPDRSVFISKDNEDRWHRITMPLPYAALTSSTRFRWKELADQQGSNWAIDDVYIGPACPKMCSGHGQCGPSGQCQCDLGFTGQDCGAGLNSIRKSLEEYFNNLSSTGFSSASGAVVGYECGLLASGKALVFNQPGPRELTTVEMNSTGAHYLKFTIRVGSHSTVSSCSPPNDPAEGILLHYSCNNGISWSFLKHVAYNENRNPSFNGSSEAGGWRYVETQSIEVGATYMIQFELAVDCDRNNLMKNGRKICLEFSTNHGLTWQLVTSECLPGQPGCDNYHGASCYDNTVYSEWVRVTIPLSRKMRSLATRFRWIQKRFQPSDSWAIDNIYIGEQCPRMCNGHGTCDRGICRWVETTGVRQLVSHDIDTIAVDFVQFTIKLGGSTSGCYGADSREEAVLLQYSNNGGIQWDLLLEIHYEEYKTAKFVHQSLPLRAKTASTRFRWWQPFHSGVDQDQWALDDVFIGNDQGFQTNQNDQPMMSISNGDMEMDYCIKKGPALVFRGTEGDRSAVTTAIDVTTGFIIQFRIVVGCMSKFAFIAPVYLQYSHDNGMTWELVEPACGPSGQGDALCGKVAKKVAQEGSIYHMGQYSLWHLVVIELPEYVVGKKTQFRWHQDIDRNAPVFALGDVYIGTPCPQNCNGHGVCTESGCVCDLAFSGPSCKPHTNTLPGLNDQFEWNTPQQTWWDKTVGTEINQDCGQVKMGNSLYFGMHGPREAVTIGVNTTTIKILQFYIRIGNSEKGYKCKEPTNLDESVIVQYTNDNGIHWNTLRELNPFMLKDAPQQITIELPPSAKTEDTKFRWWQPTSSLVGQPYPRAQWALDNVLIGANDTKVSGFQDDFNPITDKWYMLMGGLNQVVCQSQGFAQTFQGARAVPRYAETWDFEVKDTTFLQFDLVIGCEESLTFPNGNDVHLEFSVNMGKTWNLVTEKCLPPNMGCGHYRSASIYNAQLFMKWKRVSLILPKAAVSPATRFRWSQPQFRDNSDKWALDNVYLGNGCPWMCSGHGKCHHGKCKCDPGYGEKSCVPIVTRPNILKEDFDNATVSHEWIEQHGFEMSQSCGIMVSNQAAVFNQDGLRLLSSTDLDAFMMEYIQFTMRFGCSAGVNDAHRGHSVLVQYSNNGGIIWKTLKEIYSPSAKAPKFFNIQLSANSLSNKTRFRFWQPRHTGANKQTWAIDNVVIGGNLMTPRMILEDFQKPEQLSSSWLFHPGGSFSQSYCSPTSSVDKADAYSGDAVSKFRQTYIWIEQHGFQMSQSCGIMVSNQAAVFNQDGLRLLSSTDLDAFMMEYIQFTMRFGCSAGVNDAHRGHSVLVQYSNNGGIIWKTLKEIYSPSAKAPKFFNIQLSANSLSNKTRFRFWQPRHTGANKQTWAIDNVVIGGNLMTPRMILEDFQKPEQLSSSWLFHPGGSFSQSYCSPTSSVDKADAYSGDAVSKLIDTRKALVFHRSAGERFAMTTDVHVDDYSLIQFEINIGCTSYSSDKDPVRLDYSRDHGSTWELLRPNCYATNFSSDACSRDLHTPSIYYSGESPDWRRISISLNGLHICGSVRFRWVQGFYEHGESPKPWGLDTVYIGPMCHCSGHGFCQDRNTCLCDEGYAGEHCQLVRANPVFLTESFEGPLERRKFIQWSGGEPTKKCGVLITGRSMHFTDSGRRILVTTDMDLTTATVVQFYIRLGCEVAPGINRDNPVLLQYSTNGGLSWILIEELRFNKKNNSVIYVALELPYMARYNASRLRWWQPSTNGTFQQAWAIDQIYIGGDIHGKRFFKEDFQYNVQNDDNGFALENDPNWMISPGSTRATVCGSQRHVLSFADNTLMRYTITSDVLVDEFTFLQFELSMGCDETLSCYSVELEFSIDMGKTWSLLQKECMLNQVDCLHYRQGSIYTADEYHGWNRVVIHLPAHTR
ncbi:reelin-like [Anneissia japonica]|uniref:reelin-like n=1 Tax=Anneissia japonica TaxID=1529436 RepID=UPI001425A097|nr:reelin-like [Anneissia japonica]